MEEGEEGEDGGMGRMEEWGRLGVKSRC